MKNILLYTAILFSCLFASSCEREYEADAPSANNSGTDALGDAKWLKSFVAGKKSYYVFFSSAYPREGSNLLQASIYLDNVKSVAGYKIEIDPRMPDMDNHSSPNNKALVWNAEKGVYEGALNLTMTGWWRLNLKIYNEKDECIGGNDVVGRDLENGGSSAIYWDVDI